MTHIWNGNKGPYEPGVLLLGLFFRCVEQQLSPSKTVWSLFSCLWSIAQWFCARTEILFSKNNSKFVPDPFFYIRILYSGILYSKRIIHIPIGKGNKGRVSGHSSKNGSIWLEQEITMHKPTASRMTKKIEPLCA